MKKNITVNSIEEFKKNFFPNTYKQELMNELTEEEKMELIVRRSLKSVTIVNDPPKSTRVAEIEDIENSNN